MTASETLAFYRTATRSEMAAHMDARRAERAAEELRRSTPPVRDMTPILPPRSEGDRKAMEADLKAAADQHGRWF